MLEFPNAVLILFERVFANFLNFDSLNKMLWRNTLQSAIGFDAQIYTANDKIIRVNQTYLDTRALLFLTISVDSCFLN